MAHRSLRTAARCTTTAVASLLAGVFAVSACSSPSTPPALSRDAAPVAVAVAVDAAAVAPTASQPAAVSVPTRTNVSSVARSVTLRPGDSGPRVTTVQRELAALGYWNGKADGRYGQVTAQAVMALQKAAGLGRDGVYGPATSKALKAGVRPKARLSGSGIEIDKRRQLLLVVRAGKVTTILNTSTGSGERYFSRGAWHTAATPAGTFRTFRTVNGSDRGPLGDLWRPRYFNGGIAVHGAPSIPGYAASHGCARVSNAAMDMIWSTNLMPVGSRVVVY